MQISGRNRLPCMPAWPRWSTGPYEPHETIASAIDASTANSRSAFCSTVGFAGAATSPTPADAAAVATAATATGRGGGDCGLNTSTVTAPVITSSNPARNGALSWSKLLFIAAVRSVLITGAPPNTSGIT